MSVLKVCRDVDAVDHFLDTLLVYRFRVLALGRRLSRRLVLIDLDAVHEDRALVLSAQTLKYGYDVFSFVATHKLPDGSIQ